MLQTNPTNQRIYIMAKSFKYNREDSYEANCQLMANFMSYKTARANKHVQQTTTEATAPTPHTTPRLTAVKNQPT